MTLLIYALVVLLFVVVAIAVLRSVSDDPIVSRVGPAVLLLVGVLVIANRAGVF